MIESFDEPAIMSPNSKMVDDDIPIESLIDQTLTISDVSNLQQRYNITLHNFELVTNLFQTFEGWVSRANTFSTLARRFLMIMKQEQTSFCDSKKKSQIEVQEIEN